MTYRGIEHVSGRYGAPLGRHGRDAETELKRCLAEIGELERRIDSYTLPNNPHLFPEPGQREAALQQACEDLALERDRLPALQAAAVDPSPRFYLRRVRLDSSGFDTGGAYWGIGSPLYHYESESGADSGFFRIEREDVTRAFKARGGVPIGSPGYDEFRRRYPVWNGEREAAKDAVREIYPTARFWR